ncbi:MAG: hypothetical protein EOO06_01180 [Chitinophagaceae bacterium]|nr:MAG: hypothetical protein EOO06_01180 [Chitinophagaceae bacterium]
MDFKLDPYTNDIIWTNGPLLISQVTQPFTETVAQRLKIRLLTFQGEWFMDTTYGVPWFQRILGIKQSSKSAVDLIFQQKILEEPGVKEIVSFDSTFVNRQYSLSFKVRVVTGEITSPIVINPVN